MLAQEWGLRWDDKFISSFVKKEEEKLRSDGDGDEMFVTRYVLATQNASARI